MNSIPDLTPEERKECLEAYVYDYLHSTKGAASKLHLTIQLKSIGLDLDEIREIFESLGEP